MNKIHEALIIYIFLIVLTVFALLSWFIIRDKNSNDIETVFFNSRNLIERNTRIKLQTDILANFENDNIYSEYQISEFIKIDENSFSQKNFNSESILINEYNLKSVNELKQADLFFLLQFSNEEKWNEIFQGKNYILGNKIINEKNYLEIILQGEGAKSLILNSMKSALVLPYNPVNLEEVKSNIIIGDNSAIYNIKILIDREKNYIKEITIEISENINFKINMQADLYNISEDGEFKTVYSGLIEFDLNTGKNYKRIMRVL
jgi:hypothetical protein